VNRREALRKDWSLQPDHQAFERILAGHQKLFAGLG
jgi:hypothetical protein